MKLIYKIIFILPFLSSLNSCVPYSNLRTFSSTEEAIVLPSKEPIKGQQDLILQAGDVLLIQVSTEDQNLAAPFNLTQNIAAGGANPGTLIGYLVDSQGDINFSIVGKIAVINKTIREVELIIKDKLSSYLKNPTVIARILNFRVTVLGEVNSPGSFNLKSDRVTLLEILGLAGDFTPYSNRRKVLVVRESGGERITGFVDTQSSEIFSSPFFYLKQNDVIYVDPIKQKRGVVRDPITEILPWFSAGIATIGLIITLVR